MSYYDQYFKRKHIEYVEREIAKTKPSALLDYYVAKRKEYLKELLKIQLKEFQK